MTGRYNTLVGSCMTARAFAPRRGLPSRNQIRAWASRTCSLAMPVVELLFAVPLDVLEILEGRHSASLVLAEGQVARRRLRLFFADHDDPDGPLLQTARWLQEFNAA